MAWSAEGIGCPTLRTARFPKIAPLLVALALLPAGCSDGDRPDPEALLDRAFSRSSLLAGEPGPTTVEVASLGFRDRVLQVREVPVTAGTRREILEALASGPSSEGAALGLVSLAGDLETGERGEVAGVESYPVSGTIETGALLRALEEGGGTGVEDDLGIGGPDPLGETLEGVEFTAWVAERSGDLERLDLVVELDDPGNALPPSRLRFRLDDPVDAAGVEDNARR